MQVTYILLELWPKAMSLPGRKTCEDSLHFLASNGYALHDLAIPEQAWQYGASSGLSLQTPLLVQTSTSRFHQTVPL